MGRCANETARQLEIASYRDLVTEPRGLAYIIVVTSNLGVEVPNRQI